MKIYDGIFSFNYSVLLLSNCVGIQHTGIETSWCVQVHLVNSEVSSQMAMKAAVNMNVSVYFLSFFVKISTCKPASLITFSF